MPIDELSAYYAEILAIEESHFEALYAVRDDWGLRNQPAWARDLDFLRRRREDLRDAPPWAGDPEIIRENLARIETILEIGSDLNSLREIQERHGILAGDPRVFSIASFLDALRSMRAASDGGILEHRKPYRADPNVRHADTRDFYHNINRELSCEARHFPGYKQSDHESIGYSRPKAWRHITDTLDALTHHRHTHEGRVIIAKATQNRAEEIYSILMGLQIPWAPDPLNYPRDFDEHRYRVQLRSFANRLEAEEAESLPAELRRKFAHASEACARIEKLSFPDAGVAETSTKPEARQTRLGPVPTRDAFAAYRLCQEAGLNQKEAAKQLQKQLRIPFDQPKVSRLIRSVQNYLDRGNPMSRPEKIGTDPKQ